MRIRQRVITTSSHSRRIVAWLLWQGLARLVSRDCDGLTAPCVYHDTPSVASVETGGFLVAYTIHGDQQNAFDYTSDFLATILGRQQIYTLGTGLGVPPNPTISSGSDASVWVALQPTTYRGINNWSSTTLLVSVTESCTYLFNNWGEAVAIGVKTMKVYLADDGAVEHQQT